MSDVIDPNMRVREGVAGVIVEGERIELELDQQALGEQLAQAAADAIAEGIKAISDVAPDGHKLFNRTGRLANGIEAVAGADGGFDIVPPEGYLLDDGVFDHLVELVPEIDDPFRRVTMTAAVEQAADDVVKDR